MEVKNASIITMSSAELNLKFKKFLKDNCEYNGTLSTVVDYDEDGVVIEVNIGEFTEEQEDKMSKYNICLSMPCPPALGMDLFYANFGIGSELVKVDNGVKIIQYNY